MKDGSKDEYVHEGPRLLKLCEPLAAYCKATRPVCVQETLFKPEGVETSPGDIRVVELFAGVGGFRVGLERASSRFKTVWSNQWEPSTMRQDASLVYCRNFGAAGHSNEDIATVPTSEIPAHDLLVGGFPCQDYSVATTLARSGGIQGKKGVLWWQIHRIISESGNRPKFLFFENVDRLLVSPSTQRGRDFAIILASLSDLGYTVEWRVINAAEYGMPQRRRRTYIVGYRNDTSASRAASSSESWLLAGSVIAQAFPARLRENAKLQTFKIEGSLAEITEQFNAGPAKTRREFGNAGIIRDREVATVMTSPLYSGPQVTLGQVLLPEAEVPEEFFIGAEELSRWTYLKGSKKEARKARNGHEYMYAEGGMAFPDPQEKPSRTIITGEGGSAPSRFKHVVKTASGRFRRLTPVELERLNMFPDRHTEGVSATRRAFLMGNALVTGVVEQIGGSLLRWL